MHIHIYKINLRIDYIVIICDIINDHGSPLTHTYTDTDTYLKREIQPKYISQKKNKCETYAGEM